MSTGKESRIFGALGSVSLDDLVQLLGMNRRTATLVLTRPGEEGRIYFDAGTVVHAYLGELEGRQAVGRLVTWRDAEFVIEEGIPQLERTTLSDNATSLMLSALADLDEQSRTQPVAEDHAAAVSPRPAGRVRVRPRGRVTAPVITAPPPPVRSGLPIGWIAVGAVTAAAAVALYVVAGPREEPRPATAAAAPNPADVATPEPAPAEEARVVEAVPAEDEQTEPPPTDTGLSEPRPGDPAAAPEPTAPAATPTPAPSHGYLVAHVEPSATVSLDGRSLGQTPLRTLRLPVGEHTLTLENPDVAGLIQDRIVIAPGETLQRRYSFAETGFLQVVVKPWAEVLVDGRHVGQTPMAKLPITVGEHTVTMRHPEVGERSEVIRIEAGKTAHVRVSLIEDEGMDPDADPQGEEGR